MTSHEHEQGKSSRTLSWWCFNPGIAMQNVGSIVFSPGTLSPFDSFAQELKLYGLELSHFVHQAVPLIQLFGIVILQNTNKRIFSIQCETQPLVDIRNVGDITRVSEDLDFADNAGGTVVITGMPFSTRTETPRHNLSGKDGCKDLRGFLFLKGSPGKRNEREEGGWKEKKKRSLQGKKMTSHEHEQGQDQKKGDLVGNRYFPVQLENPHVMSSNQIWAGVVSLGPSGLSILLRMLLFWLWNIKSKVQREVAVSEELDFADNAGGTVVITGMPFSTRTETPRFTLLNVKQSLRFFWLSDVNIENGYTSFSWNFHGSRRRVISYSFLFPNLNVKLVGASVSFPLFHTSGELLDLFFFKYSRTLLSLIMRHETASKLIDIIEDATLLVVEYKKQGAKGSRLIGYLLLFLSRAPSHGGERASSSMVTSVNRGLIDELEIPICNTTKESNFLVYGKRLLNHPIHPKERGRGLCICMTPVDFSILPRDTIPCNFGQTLAFCLGRSLLIVGKRSKGQNMVQREVAESWKALTTSLQIHVQDAKVTATDIFKALGGSLGNSKDSRKRFIRIMKTSSYKMPDILSSSLRHTKIGIPREVIQDTQLVVLQSRNCNAKTSTEIGVGSIVFSPGTLSPFDSFAQELKLLSLPLSPFDSFAQELKLYGLELSHLVHQVSEDLDFADNAGGTVVITGMPFSTRTETPRHNLSGKDDLRGFLFLKGKKEEESLMVAKESLESKPAKLKEAMRKFYNPHFRPI
ncbi:hypothetical protein V6N13_134486 [Hibiscus sabdariffa]